MEAKYLAFKMDEDLFLIKIDNVNSIIQKSLDDIRIIPEAPQYVEGISSLRERALLIINGQKLFNKKHFIKEEYVVIVLKNENSILGLIVDQVVAVIQIDEDKIQTKNSFIYASSMTDGVYLDKDQLYLVLNPEKLLKLKID